MVNAALCVLDHIGNWCNFYLAAIEDSREHEDVIILLEQSVLTGNDQPIRNLLLSLLTRYVAAAISEQPEQSGRLESYPGEFGTD